LSVDETTQKVVDNVHEDFGRPSAAEESIRFGELHSDRGFFKFQSNVTCLVKNEDKQLP